MCLLWRTISLTTKCFFLMLAFYVFAQITLGRFLIPIYICIEMVSWLWLGTKTQNDERILPKLLLMWRSTYTAISWKSECWIAFSNNLYTNSSSVPIYPCWFLCPSPTGQWLSQPDLGISLHHEAKPGIDDKMEDKLSNVQGIVSAVMKKARVRRLDPSKVQ